MAAAFFRGTGIDQNVKFKDKDKQLIKETEWPPEFEQQVDLSQVQIDVIKAWMEQRIPELMGMEDEVVCVYAHAQLEECATNIDKPFCPKTMQIYMTGFMGDTVKPFMAELQNLLLAAQKDPRGIPPSLVKEKQSEKEKKLQAIEEAKKKIAMLKKLQGSGLKSGFSDGPDGANFSIKKEASPSRDERPSHHQKEKPRPSRHRSRSDSSDSHRHRSSHRRQRRDRSQSSSLSLGSSDDSRDRKENKRHRHHRSSRDHRHKSSRKDHKRSHRRHRRRSPSSSEREDHHRRYRRDDSPEDRGDYKVRARKHH